MMSSLLPPAFLRATRLALRAAWFVPALLCLATAAHAITADELLPANIPGKTFVFTHTAATPNTLDGAATFTVQFTSATTYVRSGGGTTTEGGVYSILSTVLTTADTRTTTILFSNNWLAPGSNVAVAMSLTNANSLAGYVVTELLNASKASVGSFSINGSTSGGGSTGAPVVTSATTATATVGTPFTYQITASPAATSYNSTGGTIPIQISNLGLITANFTAAGTYTFSYTVANATGSTKPTVVTVTVTGGSTGGTVASYAGTYTGSIFVAANGAAERVFTAFTGTISTTGVLVAQGGEVTGNVNASGVITFDRNGLNMTTGTIVNQQLNSIGTAVVLGTTSSIYRIAATGGSGTVVAGVAPANLVGYRNKVGQIFQFSVTGANTGAVWGTDVYTDDSSVATAAVHAGVLAVGETKTVTLTILPGQSSYTSSTRNGIKASSWGAWSGSYSFAGVGTVTGTSVATARPALAPGFTALTYSLAAGGRFVLPINIVGGGTYTYQWYLNGISISGAIANPYVIDSLTAANAGTYSVDVTNSLGTSRLVASTITVGSAGAPVISLQPLNKTVSPGGTFLLAVSASGTNNTYQWLRNGNSINGETAAFLLRQNVTASDAGTYSARITNSSGTVTSAGGVVALSPTASRPANISCRTNIAAGGIVTPGFVVQGTGTKNVLIRAVGPTLGGFGLSGVMADPQFKVIRQDTGATIATNDNWDSSLTSASAAVGAFTLTPGSKDAAAVVTLTAGQAYTVQVSGVGTSSGIVLIEVYDADTAPTSKLVNVSVRGQTGVDADVLILGLVIQGDGQRTLLIRGGGPALAAFGVTGTVADPRLEIFDSNSRSVLTNDDWGSASFVAELEQARQFVGAFAFAAGSKDAATLALLDPGAYTIQVSGANRGTGEALVEVYDVP